MKILKKQWFLFAMLVVGVVAFYLPDNTVVGNKSAILAFLKSISRYLIAFTFVVVVYI